MKTRDGEVISDEEEDEISCLVCSARHLRGKRRPGAEADPGFFLGVGAPLRNGVTDW